MSLVSSRTAPSPLATLRAAIRTAPRSTMPTDGNIGIVVTVRNADTADKIRGLCAAVDGVEFSETHPQIKWGLSRPSRSYRFVIFAANVAQERYLSGQISMADLRKAGQ